MKVYNENKTEVLKSYDLTKGLLKPDKILKEKHEAVPAVEAITVEMKIAEITASGGKVEEINGIPYKVIAEYENGGKDIEKIEESPAVPAKEAYDEYEDIEVYIPYTEQEIKAAEKEKQIQEYKKYLSDTDYIVLKMGELLADGNAEAVAATKTEYTEQLAKRKQAREKINELEQ